MLPAPILVVSGAFLGSWTMKIWLVFLGSVQARLERLARHPRVESLVVTLRSKLRFAAASGGSLASVLDDGNCQTPAQRDLICKRRGATTPSSAATGAAAPADA